MKYKFLILTITLLLMSLTVNLNKILNPNHSQIFKCTEPELIVYGGAGAGKSFSIADKFILQGIIQPDRPIKVIVIRRTFPSLRNTCIDILQKRSKAFGIPLYLNKAEWHAQARNVKFIFMSLNCSDDFDKLKSLTDVDFIWFNELPEIREADYEEGLRRIRGGEADYEQCISDFNPIGKTTWVYKRFFEKNIGSVKKLRYTVLDNHPDFLNTEKAQRYIEKLKRTRDYNPNLYKIYFLGEWGELEGVIFEWDVTPKPLVKFDEIFYGGDFGFSVDPATLVRIYRRADEYWVEEMIYETGLTNQDLVKKMNRHPSINKDSPMYWDCAEPKSIQEIKNGGYNALPCFKGPDSVREGVDFLKQCTIHVIDGSDNITREQRSFVWAKDKDGNNLNVPVGFNDHTMAAIRYGICTHARSQGIHLYTGKMHEER